jgi:hypothetical protein
MTTSNGTASEPNETTGLLKKDATKASDTSLSGNGSSNESVIAGRETDVENGTAETSDGEGEGEGNEEDPALKVRKHTRTGLLVPAVAIGVWFFFFLFLTFSRSFG